MRMLSKSQLKVGITIPPMAKAKVLETIGDNMVVEVTSNADWILKTEFETIHGKPGIYKIETLVSKDIFVSTQE